MRLDNPKRKELRKDCEKFWLMDILQAYRNKVEVNKNPKLYHLARVVYSDYLLLKKSINWKCTCITCSIVMPRDDPNCQPWHFRKAWTSLKHKYNDDNVYPQCMRCNVMLDWNYVVYTLRMQDMRGRERVETIRHDSETKAYKNRQYAEMIQERFTYIQSRLCD